MPLTVPLDEFNRAKNKAVCLITAVVLGLQVTGDWWFVGVP